MSVSGCSCISSNRLRNNSKKEIKCPAQKWGLKKTSLDGNKRPSKNSPQKIEEIFKKLKN